MGRPPILFLDIDGVLNDHTWHQPADSTTIDKPCMDRLNKIIAETGCDIVISTAWRYMVHSQVMNVIGFFQMLRTHGLTKHARIIGLTHPDEVRNDGTTWTTSDVEKSDRGHQIQNWLNMFGADRHYCVVDDRDDLGIQQLHAANFIQTQSNVGMTDLEMERIIEVLKR